VTYFVYVIFFDKQHAGNTFHIIYLVTIWTTNTYFQ